jgi:hypothetical protein
MLSVSPEPADLELLAYTLVGAGELAGRWWLEHPDVSKERIVERFVGFCRPAIVDALRSS